MAEITSVLFYNVMRYDPKDPRNPAGDRFVLSKVNGRRNFLSAEMIDCLSRVIVLLFSMLLGPKPVLFP